MPYAEKTKIFCVISSPDLQQLQLQQETRPPVGQADEVAAQQESSYVGRTTRTHNASPPGSLPL